MSADPNGNRWAKSDNFGKSMLKKSGWTEGAGLGKDASGVQEHIKVSRKADTMGIGYNAGVQDTWTTQSVGFADVLDRIKSKVVADDSDDSDVVQSPVSSPNTGAPSASRHYKMYAKRNALKTELLRTTDTDKSEEILGSASSKRRHADDDDDEHSAKKRAKKESDSQSSLKSSVLSRIMVRCTKDEPKPNVDGEITNHVHITKPNPRPPKCTASPFLAA